MINSITNFLSSKINLTILQCILYLVLGYMLSNHYTWGQFSIIFIVLFGIQFITHIKGVGHGMMLHQIMQDERHHFMEYIKRIKKLDKDDNIEDDLPN